MKRNVQKPGFTVLELTFAIVVIGVMMGVVMTTILGMLRFYTFAGVVRQNQAAGRQAVDDMTRQIRFTKIIEPVGADPSDVLCMADVKNSLLLEYKKVAGTNASGKPIEYIQKTTYRYDTAATPTACGAVAGVTQLNQAAITPETMHVKSLQFVRTGGALLSLAGRGATAVVIEIDVISGTASPDTGDCVGGDIYCSQLQLNTAVEVQGG